jgi:hypothetical protein
MMRLRLCSDVHRTVDRFFKMAQYEAVYMVPFTFKVYTIIIEVVQNEVKNICKSHKYAGPQ